MAQKSCKCFTFNGLIGLHLVQFKVPKALKFSCLIQFWSWVNSLFPLLALWGNKNWPPSMKVEKLKIFWDKMGSMGCIWSSLNAPGTENTQKTHQEYFVACTCFCFFARFCGTIALVASSKGRISSCQHPVVKVNKSQSNQSL